MTRVLEAGSAALVTTLLLPLLLIIGLLVKATSRGPAVFRQERVGLGGKRFVIYKFRTLRHGTGSGSVADLVCEKDWRVTPVGRFLRWSHLDELLQLLNILKGDMTFVGPRPITPQIAEVRRGECARYRAPEVRPGVTGLRQVCQREEFLWEHHRELCLGLDAWYAKNKSFRLDCWIVWQTLLIPFFGKWKPESLERKLGMLPFPRQASARSDVPTARAA